MTRTALPSQRRRRRTVPAALAVLATATAGLVAAGCGSADDTATSAAATSGGSGSSKALQTVVVGVVPSLDLGVLGVGERQGFFEEAGVKLKISNVDSGPNVVTGVVAGTYDVGGTAYAPPLLAVGQGAPLKVVSNTGTVGPDGTNSGTLVRKDSGIERWSDLAGKKVATNAPRSLLSLSIPAAVAKDGGDPSAIKIVPLPFNAIAKAVADGQVDAGAVLEPFQTAALKGDPDLVDLGDSIFATEPQGSPGALYFSGPKADADKIAAFKVGLQKSLSYANAHVDEVKAAGAPLAGLTAEQAKAIPLNEYTPDVSAADLEPLVDEMVQFNWLERKPDLTAFVG